MVAGAESLILHQLSRCGNLLRRIYYCKVCARLSARGNLPSPGVRESASGPGFEMAKNAFASATSRRGAAQTDVGGCIFKLQLNLHRLMSQAVSHRHRQHGMEGMEPLPQLPALPAPLGHNLHSPCMASAPCCFGTSLGT